jgi:hypothetical protein
MVLHTTWSKWFINHASNDAGNQNLKAFSKNLSLNNNNVTRLRQLVEEIDTVNLAADANNRIMILHPPRILVGLELNPKTK